MPDTPNTRFINFVDNPSPPRENGSTFARTANIPAVEETPVAVFRTASLGPGEALRLYEHEAELVRAGIFRRIILPLTAVAVMAVMMNLVASPAWAQGSYGPNYGPNGPYWGPYDYCGWSPYACPYPPAAPPSAMASPPTTPPSPTVMRQLPATGGLNAIPLFGLGAGALLVASGLLASKLTR